MPVIKPFRGLRYNASQVRDLTKVFCPPYDIISKKDQAKLYSLHAQNAVRVELAQTSLKDTALNNRYTRAASELLKWQENGVLVREDEPALYVVEQFYKEEGRPKRRLGFLAAMKIDLKAVKKHENTLKGPKEDRLHLIKAVHTNLSPIFGLFEDPSSKIQKTLSQITTRKPEIDVNIAGVRHRVFVEKDTRRIALITKAIAKKPMFIADGHHRFEVACQFKEWMDAQKGRNPEAPWHSVMTYFADAFHNPFKIFPTHRLVKFPKAGDPFKKLAERGTLKKVSGLPAVLKALAAYRSETKDKAYNFGIFTRKRGFELFTLSRAEQKKVRKDPVAALDVAALHRFIVEPCFNIHAIEKSEHIDFTRDPQDAVSRVKNKEFDAALFLRPTSLAEMMIVCKKGLKMPQKSTYFYPKLLTGPVFCPLN